MNHFVIVFNMLSDDALRPIGLCVQYILVTSQKWISSKTQNIKT